MTIVYDDRCPVVPGRTGDSANLQYILGFNSEYEARYLDVNSLIYNNVPRGIDINNYDRLQYALSGFLNKIIDSQEYLDEIHGPQGHQGIQGPQGSKGTRGNSWDNQSSNIDINHLRNLFNSDDNFIEACTVILKLLLGNIDNKNLWNLSSTEIVFDSNSGARGESYQNQFKANGN